MLRTQSARAPSARPSARTPSVCRSKRTASTSDNDSDNDSKKKKSKSVRFSEAKETVWEPEEPAEEQPGGSEEPKDAPAEEPKDAPADEPKDAPADDDEVPTLSRSKSEVLCGIKKGELTLDDFVNSDPSPPVADDKGDDEEPGGFRTLSAMV